MDEENDLVSANVLHAHMHSFFNECRAYGRLVEASQNGKIAVRCLRSHTSVPVDKEEELARKFNIQTRDRPEEDYANPVSQRQPFRAVVKELVREPVALTQKVDQDDAEGLERRCMRELGVYRMDVRARNYEGWTVERRKTVPERIAYLVRHAQVSSCRLMQTCTSKQTALVVLVERLTQKPIHPTPAFPLAHKTGKTPFSLCFYNIATILKTPNVQYASS